MIADGINRFDINQGAIGNCWFQGKQKFHSRFRKKMINVQHFSAAVAKLAEDKTRFDLVVPQGQDFSETNYAGIFRFRFWRFGTWTEVVIDDRLPTHNGQLEKSVKIKLFLCGSLEC